jgi:thymidylate synthase (FAD)
MIDLNNILGDYLGKMEVIQQVGDDKMAVNAARVSLANDGMEDMLTFSDRRLINYLVRHEHGSPFEHNLLTVKVKLPLNIGEQWIRHRAGWSYNKESGRYINLSNPEFYVPVIFRRQSSDNRQASEGEVDSHYNEIARITMSVNNNDAVADYQKLIAMGIAKEQARLLLPQSLYMSMYATCNLRSLMHFVKLRDHEGAQWEMQQYAKALKQIAQQYWPVSIAAMEEHL